MDDRLEGTDHVEVWQRLGLLFPTQQERERWQRVYFFDTTPALFWQWLDDRIDSDFRKHEAIANLGRGHIYVNRLHVVRNGIYRMWIHCTYEVQLQPERGPAQTKFEHLGACINFRALPLSPVRIKLECNCLTPRVVLYYRSLLTEIGLAWPEAKVKEVDKRFATKIIPTRTPNAERDAKIYEEAKAGSKRHELADKWGVGIERIKQILREQRYLDNSATHEWSVDEDPEEPDHGENLEAS